MTKFKFALVLLAMTGTVFLNSCEEDPAEPTDTPSETQGPDLTNLGMADVIFYNGTTIASNPLVVKQENPNNGSEVELATLELNENTDYTSVFSGIPNDLNFYWQEPSRLFKGGASGERELDNDAKYTVIACCASLEEAIIIKDQLNGSDPSKAYVRGVNLRGNRFVLTIGSLETYLNLGPNSAGTNSPPATEAYKEFQPIEAGEQKVVTANYNSAVGPSLENDFGVRTFQAGKYYTLINNVKTTNGDVALYIIEHN